MRSLTWKLSLAFWVVSLVGILLVALFAGALVRERSAELENRINRDTVTEALQNFYERNNGWPKNRIPSNQIPGRRSIDWIVFDPQTDDVLFSNPSDPRRLPSASVIQRATSLIVDGEEVGRLVLLEQRGSSDQDSRVISQARNDFLSSVWRSLAYGAVAATGLSLLVGLLIARQLTRPIQALTHATRAVARGELDQQVKVHSSDELGELADAFNQMGRDLADAQRARRQMTADIAHDLRTPLSIIQGHTEGLLDGVLPSSAETYSIIHDESLRLNRLIEDLRTLSLADAGKLSLMLRPVQPLALLERAVIAYAPLAEDRGVTLRLDVVQTLPELPMDNDRMAQVLDNLISNALRYTASGGEIIIRGRMGEMEGQTALVIDVQDDGEGISASDLPYIFERSYRADKSRQRNDDNRSGSGLGLAISKSVVEQHGGNISAASQVGKGSTFTIRLPIGDTL